ncbi:hypothetical protein JXB27_01740 [Candidatus Woesearchaeota archaeon]|nr:hypothetical protein [Candidatus Woesearchaeota archaeon]
MTPAATLTKKGYDLGQHRLRIVHKKREVEFLAKCTYYLEALDIVRHLIEVNDLLMDEGIKQNENKLKEELTILTKIGKAIKQEKPADFERLKKEYFEYLEKNGVFSELNKYG